MESGDFLMVSREQRLAEFGADQPTVDLPYELLCEDGSGTYALKFPARWSGSDWVNQNSGLLIAAKVVGWRRW